MIEQPPLAALDSVPRGGALTIGNFDGVHVGHAALIERLCALARRLGGPSVVLTFDPHPVALLRPELALTPLTTMARRVELLTRLGVEHVVVYPTDPFLLGLEAKAFFQKVVLGRFAARGMVEGPNFFFGRGRGGDVQLLDGLCREHDVELEIVSPRADHGEMVSSSRVRRQLVEGDLEGANRNLTERYQLSGRVVSGDQRGRKLGFPTANLESIPVLVPAPGVYATRAWIDGRPRVAATHIGPNPTFGGLLPKVEVHVLDFSGDLYGRELTIDFVGRVRDISKFPSVDALREQLTRDLERVRRIAAMAP